MEPRGTRARIRSEQEIATRSGQPFAVVVFEVERLCAHRSTLRLLRALRPHLRSGDEVGWLGRGRLAVLMPQTRAEQVRAAATTVAGGLRRRGRPHRFTLHGDDGEGEHGIWSVGGAGAPGAPLGPSLGNAPILPLSLLTCDPHPFWKRIVDVGGASVGLLLLFPVMLVAAILVKLGSPGPILFRQQRAGWLGFPFVIYKFRTMVDGADALKARLRAFNERSGPVFKMSRDPRVTPVGRLLRITSIDELPQLWNVLKGDMSLVGPRPPTLDEVRKYEPWQRRRLDVRPGITCLWQVEARGDPDFERWVRMDIRYIRQRSPHLDLMLLARTVPAVISGRGSS